MENSARIIKGNNVKLEGTFSLDSGMSRPGAAHGGTALPAAVQARILENNPQYAVIEVICSCGTKTQIRCEYESAKG
ncbi:MAG: hypothetical protein LLF92_07300 [Planctomycetaceae bacterium]|nr:hypothetical protein [Planctomycetaceae bacterium]